MCHCRSRLFDLSGIELQEIPAIAKRIAPNNDSPIRFVSRRFFELDTRGKHSRVVSGKVVCGQKETHASASLVANRCALLVSDGFGNQQAGAVIAGRGDPDPAFSSTQVNIIQ